MGEGEEEKENEGENDPLDNWIESKLLFGGISFGFLPLIVGVLVLYQFGSSSLDLVAGVLMIIIGVCVVIGVVKFARVSHGY